MNNGPTGEPQPTPLRVTVAEAAEALGISDGAVRMRVKRGTLPSEREGGRLYVLLNIDPTADPDRPHNRTNDRTAELVTTLRDQLQAERQAHAEARRIIAGLVERIPALEAPQGSAPNSSTKDLQKLPNNVLEASLQDLQALLSNVVEEAIATNQAGATQKEKLTRAREGALEALKLEHNSVQNLGILSLAAIAAFGATLGVFSDPKAWDDTWTIFNDSFLTLINIPMPPRSAIMTTTFGAFLLSAIAARVLDLRIRHEVWQAAKAEEVTEIETLQNTMRSLWYRGTLERVVLVLAFGVGVIAFLTFIGQSIN